MTFGAPVMVAVGSCSMMRQDSPSDQGICYSNSKEYCTHLEGTGSQWSGTVIACRLGIWPQNGRSCMMHPGMGDLIMTWWRGMVVLCWLEGRLRCSVQVQPPQYLIEDWAGGPYFNDCWRYDPIDDGCEGWDKDGHLPVLGMEVCNHHVHWSQILDIICYCLGSEFNEYSRCFEFATYSRFWADRSSVSLRNNSSPFKRETIQALIAQWLIIMRTITVFRKFYVLIFS